MTTRDCHICDDWDTPPGEERIPENLTSDVTTYHHPQCAMLPDSAVSAYRAMKEAR